MLRTTLIIHFACLLPMLLLGTRYPQPFAPYYSQCGQDKYLNEVIFKNKKNGVFVDIGAHDGISFSNTCYFEQYLGWTGLCVEPYSERFEELCHNRKAICVQCCVSNFNGSAEFLKISGPKDSEMLSGMYNSYDPRHVTRIKDQINDLGGTAELIQVPVVTLTSLLLQHNLKKVDFISIDTEGGELEIIKSIDFNVIDIDVIVVENNYGTPDITNFLADKGYHCVGQIEQDQIYVSSTILATINRRHRKNAKNIILNKYQQQQQYNEGLSRTLTTISCADVDYIPKVPGAGHIFEAKHGAYQLMHNGVKIEKGCYYDNYYSDAPGWMTNIIYALQGHHEPQEEKVFYEVLKYVPTGATMLELGAYWAYYSLWFAQVIPDAKNYVIEPDTARLNVAKRNFALNEKTGNFFQCYAGMKNNDALDYNNAKFVSVDELLKSQNIDHLNILHADIQGAEYLMLLSCQRSIMENKIDFFFVSTHSEQLHQQCLNFLKSYNLCIITEHSPQQSFSCDGLIVAKRQDIAGPAIIEVSKQ